MHRKSPPEFSAGSDGVEFQRYAVHAISQTGGLGAVIEHVTQMSAAAAAMDFRPDHPRRGIPFLAD